MNPPTPTNLDISTPFNGDQDKERAQLLSQAQWAAINTINDKYANQIIPETNNQFRDNNWVRHISDDFRCRSHEINWDGYPNIQNPARLLIAKDYAFKALAINNNSISTVSAKILLIDFLFGCVDHKNILKGHTGHPIVGLYAITTGDIENLIDQKVASGASPKTALIFTDALDDLKFSTGFFKTDYPFLYLDCEIPWGRGYQKLKWVNDRFVNLSIEPPEKEYYPPFGHATSMMLVERSMEILDNYADIAVELISEGCLFGNIKNETPNHRYSNQQRKIHAAKYKCVFDEIVEFEIDSSTGMVSQKFYGKLFRVVQGAMMNILLFTTGIRNLDARLLRKGCCNPSEVEGLFYLSTDLKKTKNSIDIPVPEATYKAIKVLEKMRFAESHYCPTV